LEGKLSYLFESIYPKTSYYKIVGVKSAFLNIFKGYGWFIIILTSSTILWALTIKRRMAVRSLKIVFVMILLMDLIFLGKPKDNTITHSLYTKTNETVEFMKSDPSYYRIFSLSYIQFKGFMNIPKVHFAGTFKILQNMMMPNLSIFYHIDTINEYAAILVKRYYLLFSPVREFFRLDKMEPWQMNYCKEIFNLFNVKYIISSFSLQDEDFKLIRDGRIKIYENLGVMPRAYLVPKAIMLKDDEDVLETIQEVNFSPRETILITEGEYKKASSDFPEEENLSGDAFNGKAKILKYSPNYVEILTEGNDSSFLVLADNYYPGWKVYVNGIEKNILRVNYNLRGVVIPRGKDKIQFIFDPLSFKIGAAISLLTLLGIIVSFLKRRKSKNV